MIPFFQVKSRKPQSFLGPRERHLACEMGHPPWELPSVTASQSAGRFAAEIESELVGLVFNLEFSYDHLSWQRWIDALLEDGACGMVNVPLGNQDPLWRSGLNIPVYLTLRGLEKASHFAASIRWMIQRSSRPESYDVVVAPVSILRELPEDLHIGELSNYWSRKHQKVRVFCHGWLHSFHAVKDAGCRHDLISMCEWDGLVLEFGCGVGLMAKTCREMGFDVGWIGIDLNREALFQARSILDLAVQADINLPLPLSQHMQFDRIVCGDVLEHLPYPWDFLSGLRQWMKPDGLLIASFPNVGHWSVVEDLLEGRWDETPSGVFCISHLRFGTKRSWERWFEKNGWKIIIWQEEKVPLPDQWIISPTGGNRTYDWESLETIRYRVAARSAS